MSSDLPCLLDQYQVRSNKKRLELERRPHWVDFEREKPYTPPFQSASIGKGSVRGRLVKAEMFTNLDFDQHDCTRLYMM